MIEMICVGVCVSLNMLKVQSKIKGACNLLSTNKNLKVQTDCNIHKLQRSMIKEQCFCLAQMCTFVWEHVRVSNMQPSL